jgi:5-methylcytosine-specific restriction endonuclease McrA
MNLRCSTCKEVKESSDFHKSSTTANGFATRCRLCTNKSSRAWKARSNYKSKYDESVRERTFAWKAARPWYSVHATALQRMSAGSSAESYEVIANYLNALPQECGKCGTCEDLTVDHVLPLSKGGSHTTDNLQILCRSCNATKRQRSDDYRFAAFGLGYEAVTA